MTALGKSLPGLKPLPGLQSLPGLRATQRTWASICWALTHHGLALLGLAVVLAGLTLALHPNLRQAGAEKLMAWLQPQPSDSAPDEDVAQATSQDAAAVIAEAPAVQNTTATLTGEQQRVAQWLSRKYRVAMEPMKPLVVETYVAARQAKLDPTLVLAIMAIESNFNPFAQSAVGAQGLMQVMTRVHLDKYETHGGKESALYPLPNLKVGLQVLQECIARAGSMTGGLKLYVGAGNLDDDGGYAERVLSEYARLHQVATGRPAPRELASSTSPLSATPASPASSTTSPAADKLALAKTEVLN